MKLPRARTKLIISTVTIATVLAILSLFSFVTFTGLPIEAVFPAQGGSTDVSAAPKDANSISHKNSPWLSAGGADRTPANLTFFDVGHGDCSLIQYRCKCILVDTGNCENHIAQKLIERGINRLDYVIITHSHPDHIGGLQEIQKELEIGKIIMGSSYDGDFFRVIKPLREYDIENDNSSVVVFLLNDKIVVIPGDNEFESQKEFCAKFKLDETPIYLLKYPHHGVDDYPLFTKIKAEIVMISAGTDGYKYHIPEYVIEEQQRNGSKVYWTGRDGTVEINIP